MGVLLAFLSVPLPGFCAQCARTEFTADFGPWVASEDGKWTLDSGAARCTLPASLLPLRTRLAVDIPGDFTGNYEEAGIGMIGFDLRSWSMRPSSICLDLRRGTNWIRCDFFGESTTGGQWRTFCASLAPLAPMPGWRGDIGQAAYILQGVEQVVITIWGGSPNEEQRFDVDNIFICSEPRSSGMFVGAGAAAASPIPGQMAAAGDAVPGMAVTWTGLHAGLAYDVETAPDPRGPWSVSGTITTATTTASTVLPFGSGQVARLVLSPFLGW